MTALPAATAFTGAGVTEAQFKTAITDQREFLAGLLGTGGDQAAALSALGAALNGIAAKSGAYTVIAGDRGKLIDCTGTLALSLTAAATLGAGFVFAVRNSGSGAITLDPAGSETIDGVTTIVLAAGESCLCACTGTAWLTVGRTITPTPVSYPISVANGGTAATSASAAADNLSVVKRDNRGGAVGSILLAYYTGGTTAPAVDATCPGAHLATSITFNVPSYAASGTWRCMSPSWVYWAGENYVYLLGLFQRIA